MSWVGPVLGPSSRVWFIHGTVTNSSPQSEYSAQIRNQVEPPNRADDVEPSPSSHSCLPQTLLTVTSAASPRLSLPDLLHRPDSFQTSPPTHSSFLSRSAAPHGSHGQGRTPLSICSCVAAFLQWGGGLGVIPVDSWFTRPFVS